MELDGDYETVSASLDSLFDGSNINNNELEIGSIGGVFGPVPNPRESSPVQVNALRNSNSRRVRGRSTTVVPPQRRSTYHRRTFVWLRETQRQVPPHNPEEQKRIRFASDANGTNMLDVLRREMSSASECQR